MSRHKHKEFGTCRLCRKQNVELTYEHVPPESAFNSKPVQTVTLGDVLDKAEDGDFSLKDMSGMRYQAHQRGDGGYYLCADCNSKTGAWYVNKYSEFIQCSMAVIAPHKIKHGDCFELHAKDIWPLSIFKQVMVMFCDIIAGLAEDEKLRNFLLDPTSNEFDSQKYRVFMYGFGGGLLKRTQLQAAYGVDGIICSSEIISPPLGFRLCIDLPETYKTDDCEITNFAFESYERKVDIDFILQSKGTYSIFNGVYAGEE